MEELLEGCRVPPSNRLAALPRYGRGRARGAMVFRHRLGSNEAPFGWDADLQAKVEESLRQANRYPDLRGETLIAALATRFEISQEKIAVGAGSIVLLDQLLRAFCDPGDNVVAPWRSYEAYPILAGIAGARLLEIPLDPAHRLDPRALAEAVDERCRIVILCNPNNPTGTALSETAIDTLLEALPRDVLVVLDEAYVDYSLEPAVALVSPKRRLARHPNLAILRTLSKAWGLAGLRAGYCLAHKKIVDALNAVAPPFPLPEVTLSAARAVLGRPDLVFDRINQNAAERSRLTAGLTALRLPVAESKTNFVWLPVGSHSSHLASHFADASIAVRSFDGEGVRITTGTAGDTDAVLAAAAAWQPRR